MHVSQKPHLSGSPVKEPSLKVPLWSPSQSEAPPLEPSFFHLSKAPVYEPPPHIPGSPRQKRGPRGERCPYPKTFSTYLPGFPMKELPSQTPSTEPLQGERRFIHRAPFIHLSKSPVDEPSSRFPKRGPYGRRCPSPEPFSTYPSGSPVRESSLQVPLAELPQRERETLSPWSPCQPYLKVPDRGVQSRWPN